MIICREISSDFEWKGINLIVKSALNWLISLNLVVSWNQCKTGEEMTQFEHGISTKLDRRGLNLVTKLGQNWTGQDSIWSWNQCKAFDKRYPWIGVKVYSRSGIQFGRKINTKYLMSFILGLGKVKSWFNLVVDSEQIFDDFHPCATLAPKTSKIHPL